MGKESSYSGKVLRVNLTTGKISREQFAPLRDYIGGIGVGIRIMWSEVPANVKPFDPENRLIIAAGPLNGTRVPGSGLFSVVTKGPLTNLLAASQANGFFGARLRFAGYDCIVIEGASAEWQYLWINNGEAELRPATHLAGLDTWDTDDRIKKEVDLPSTSVACIGPSGENLVRFAAIFCDRGHVASTNGCGAVMGSKKLKAIAVCGNKSRIHVADPTCLDSARLELIKGAESVFMGATIKSVGTNGWFAVQHKTSGVAVRNYTTTIWPGVEKLYGENLRATYATKFERKPKSCWACPWAHCADIKITKGQLAGHHTDEPEYESISAWNPNVGIDDIDSGVMLHALTERMGLDAKECTFAISMAIECFEKGLIGQKDTGGLELRWGNAEAIAELIKAIAYRRGFGEVLAAGVMRASEKIGGDAPNFAVYCKRGLAPHILDFRGQWPPLFSLLISDGGSFWGAAAKDPDIGIMEHIGRFDKDNIPAATAKQIRRSLVHDCIGVCMFFLYGPLTPIVELIRASTGWGFTREELLKTGERIANLARAFNIRHGMDPIKDDTVSPRISEAPVDGKAKGISLGPALPQMVRAYYREMGWDENSSKPLPETLQRLGLNDVAKELWGK